MCNQRKVCNQQGCPDQYERSCASHDWMRPTWSPENPLTAFQVLKGSTKKQKFDCPECGHTFEISPNKVTTHGRWCQYCNSTKLCDDDDCEFCWEKSFASAERADYWLKKLNKGLRPRDVCKHSKKKFWFKCWQCDHPFECQLDNVNKLKMCTFCASKKLCKDDDCKLCYEKSFVSFDEKKVVCLRSKIPARMIFKHSDEKYDFECYKCEHIFNMSMNDVTNGHWCPFCAHKKFCDEDCDRCFNNSEKSCDSVEFWSKQNKKDPRYVYKYSNKEYKFDCEECGHTFSMSLYVVNGMGCWCNYCAHKILCENPLECDVCYDNCFASYFRHVNWYQKKNGDVKPQDVFKYSGDKYYFKCDDCGTVFKSILYNISRGHWCPTCKHKTEKLVYKWLSKEEYNVNSQPTYKWCINEETGRYLKFDYSFDDIKVILEIDGSQHFRDIAKWDYHTLDERIDRDHLKMKLALEEGYTIIRILQEEILYDKIDWKKILRKAIKEYDEPQIIYLYEGEEKQIHTRSK
jgi:very-short-patch-repair endonuclease/DNA-directed RNA polymerase subunit RPC12/RpoP